MKSVIIITGTTRGLGNAIASHCLQQGNDVLAINRRPSDLAQKHTGQYHEVIADLANIQSIEQATQTIKQFCQQNDCSISHLVNSAGSGGVVGSMTTITSEQYVNVMTINVTAPLLLTNGLLSEFKPSTRVLNLSSRAAEITVPGMGLYCISKHALRCLTEAYQQDDKSRFLCGHVIPGEVDTDMQAELREQDEGKFPLADFFKKNQENLIPAAVSATFVYWLLMQASDDNFSRQSPWFIYDKEHHKQWYSATEAFPYPAP
ncbi:MAG: SDR family NAD(P)-dependent oxidoreductase [Coxiellaceae bacterium]|nr:SDR family NAD(P)-dependent oxidoreductase [Coxiellaceae bacterium]